MNNWVKASDSAYIKDIITIACHSSSRSIKSTSIDGIYVQKQTSDNGKITMQLSSNNPNGQINGKLHVKRVSKKPMESCDGDLDVVGNLSGDTLTMSADIEGCSFTAKFDSDKHNVILDDPGCINLFGQYCVFSGNLKKQ